MCEVLLHTPNEEDLQLIRKWLCREEIAHAMGPVEEGGGLTESQRRETYMIKKEDRVIGYIELTDINHSRKTAEVRICIAHPDERGKGYGTNALRCIKEQLVGNRFDSLYLRVLVENGQAVRCYEKAGFEKTAVLKRGRFNPKSMYLMEYSN